LDTREIITRNAVSSRAGIKCAIVFIVFMIFSVGPIPMTRTIGLSVPWNRQKITKKSYFQHV